MSRFAFASLMALALPLAPAQAQEATPDDSFRRDQLADPAITEAIKQGEIDVAPTGEIIVEGIREKDIRNFVWRGVTEMSGGKIAVRDETLCLSFDSIDETLEAALRERIAHWRPRCVSASPRTWQPSGAGWKSRGATRTLSSHSPTMPTPTWAG